MVPREAPRALADGTPGRVQTPEALGGHVRHAQPAEDRRCRGVPADDSRNGADALTAGEVPSIVAGAKGDLLQAVEQARGRA
eukprot:14068339-Alexandrium_andersonii.AAC.1